MASGFESYYNGVAVQLSNTARAFSLIKSGTLYESDFFTFTGIGSGQQEQGRSYANIDLPAGNYTECIVFFRNNNPSSDNRVTAKVIDRKLIVNKWWNLTLSSEGVSYYVFGRVIRPGGTRGMQLWDGKGNANENLMFDSSWYCLQVKNAFVLPSKTPALSLSTNATYTVGDGTISSNYAIALPAARIALMTQIDMTILLQECAWISSGKVNLNFVAIEGDDYAVFSPNNYCSVGSGLVLVADVSNFPLNYSI